MKRFLVFLIILLAMVLVPYTLVWSQQLMLVDTTETVLSNGDTLQTVMWVDSVALSTMWCVYEIKTTDSTRYWKLVTQVQPDVNSDNKPEILTSYIPTKASDPFDVTKDGAVNGWDFWALFIRLYWSP